jgi:hypothetical protein
MMKLGLLKASWFLSFMAVAGCDSAGKTASEKKEGEKPAAAATNKNETGEDKEQKEQAEKIDAALAKLSPEDRQQAKAQRVCPVSNEPLGAMGVPIKVTVGEESVFICCAGCEKDARENIEKFAADSK